MRRRCDCNLFLREEPDEIEMSRALADEDLGWTQDRIEIRVCRGCGTHNREVGDVVPSSSRAW